MIVPDSPPAGEVAGRAAAAALAGQRVLTPARVPDGLPPVHYTVTAATTLSYTFSAAKVRAAAEASGHPLPAMPPGLDGSTIHVTIGPIVIATYAYPGGKERADAVPALIVAQAPRPRVTSTGAGVSEIEDYLLSQPGISPRLVREIRAIGDPTTTLPIPVPIDLVAAHRVTVQGVSGLAIGDNTRVGSGVIWEKDGMVYGVAGGMPESKVLSIAETLR